MEPQAIKPLSGIKVLELARILAGPWAGQTLADLGAEVIKIERKGSGDDTRSWGPPFVKTSSGEAWGAAYFHACNRGKSSVCVDFDSEEDLGLIKRLAREADIVIENFKVGGLAKYGLDYPSLSQDNPRLIYASITGFGQDGPYAHRAGYDYIIQGMSGLMDITGEPEGAPQKVGVAVIDIFTGIYTTTAILAALESRHRTHQGAYIDMALYDVGVSILANQAMNYLHTGTSPQRLGNAHPNIVPYQVFKVKDGHMIIAVGNDAQFERLCHVLGALELANHADYKTNAQRLRARKELTQLLEPYLLRFSRTELLETLEAAGVPAGPINRIEDVFNDPQIIHRGLRLELVAEDGSGVASVASPIVINGQRQYAKGPSPRLGQGAQAWSDVPHDD